MGQTGKNRALDADSLVIRDANGNARIELGTTGDHFPILRLLSGSDNKPSVMLSSDEKGPGLTLFYQKGSEIKPSVILSSDEKGSGLTFFYGKGIMMLSNADGPSLVLAGPASNGGGGGGTSIEAGSVETYDNDNFHTFVGKMATVDNRTGSTTWSSAASLKLVRKDGKVVWQAP